MGGSLTRTKQPFNFRPGGTRETIGDHHLCHLIDAE
jgi:hypothetical protein